MAESQKNQRGNQAHNAHIGHHAVAEGAHSIQVLGNHVGKQHDQPELGDLGGLEGHDAEVQPAGGVALRRGDGLDVGVPAHQQEHQQEHGDAENHHGQLVEVVVIKGGNDQHGRHPKHGKGSLPGDEEIAVAVVIIAVSVAGREEHDQPNGQQHQNENQQGHIQPCAQAEELIPDGPAFAFPLLGGRLPLGSAGRPVTGHPAQAAGSPSHCSHRDSSFLRSFSAAFPSL